MGRARFADAVALRGVTVAAAMHMPGVFVLAVAPMACLAMWLLTSRVTWLRQFRGVQAVGNVCCSLFLVANAEAWPLLLLSGVFMATFVADSTVMPVGLDRPWAARCAGLGSCALGVAGLVYATVFHGPIWPYTGGGSASVHMYTLMCAFSVLGCDNAQAGCTVAWLLAVWVAGPSPMFIAAGVVSGCVEFRRVCDAVQSWNMERNKASGTALDVLLIFMAMSCGACGTQFATYDARVLGVCASCGLVVFTTICGNGVLEASEDCDDSNVFNGDGCSATCEFEDPCDCASGTQWLCTDERWERTECCSSLLNPVTLQKTCSCEGQVSDSGLYVITDDCRKRDVNECLDNPCIGNAVCFNKDGTAEGATEGFTCVCPPGMIGDGQTRCDVYVFQTLLQFGVKGLTEAVYDELEAKGALLSSDALPASVDGGDLVLTVNPFGGPYESVEQLRRLLGDDTGMQLTIVIMSDSALGMQTTTNNINAQNAQAALEALYNLEVYLLEPPTSMVQTVDQAFGAVNTVLSGFRVDSIMYNATAWEWVVQATYVDTSPNTITSLYVSKSGTPPYSKDVQDSFFVSRHPCMQSASVCCLADYMDTYAIGSFGANISNSVGTCPSSVQTQDTLALFNTAKSPYLVEHALDGYERSYVRRLSPNSVQLHLNRFDLRNEFAMRTDVTGGYQLEFFVGMSYYTLLPTSALATVATQTRISVTSTDTLTFATTSEQDYSFLQYITLGLYQTKVVSGAFFSHYMQFAKVGFVLPSSLQQNLRTGLVPLTSVRFAVSTVLPDALDTASWMNPCFSADNSGLWDTMSASGAPNTLRELYTAATGQDCSLQSEMCTNPPAAQLDNHLVEFWFPIGDFLINSTMTQAAERYYLFVYFDLSVVDASGRSTVTKLFAQAPITDVSISAFCESLESAQTINDITDVTMTIGTVGVAEEWDSTMVEITDIVENSDDLKDSSAEIHAKSIESALVTISVRGEDSAFTGNFAKDFHMEVDALTTLHFLDDTKYEDVSALMAAGTAWTMQRNMFSDMLEIAISPEVQQICASGSFPGEVSCAIRHDIHSRTVDEAYAVHPLATGVGTHNPAADVEWLTRHLFGDSEFAREYAANFTRLTRKRYDINDRYNKAWFINAGYPWASVAGSAAQSVLSLSDKMILVAIITLDDENPTTGPSGGRRRMLLEQTVNRLTGEESRTLHTLHDNPVYTRMPSIRNTAVDTTTALATAFKAQDNYKIVRVSLPEMSNMDGQTDVEVRDNMQAHLQAHLKQFAPTATNVRIVQCNLHGSYAKQQAAHTAAVARAQPIRKPRHSHRKASRHLLQDSGFVRDGIPVTLMEGYMTLLLEFDQVDNLLYTDQLLLSLTLVPNGNTTNTQKWAQDVLLANVQLVNATNPDVTDAQLTMLHAAAKTEVKEYIDDAVAMRDDYWTAEEAKYEAATAATGAASSARAWFSLVAVLGLALPLGFVYF